MNLPRALPVLFCVALNLSLTGAAAQAQVPRPADARENLRERTGVPRLLKFADALRDGQGAPRRGTAGITFSIYAEREGGAALWQETQNVPLDADGRYSVLLGAASRDGMPAELFATGEPRWIGVRVNVAGDADASAEQARVLLVSVPYALRAADAETLGGRAAADFVLREELVGWSGVAAGVLPGAADAPRAVGGTQGVVNATGAVSFMPRVTAINSPAPGDVTYGNSQIFDDGTNIRIGNAAVGTGLVNIELTTPNARNAFNSTLRLENTAPILGTVISAMNLTGADRATSDHESFQVARFTLLKNVISTGVATNFDAIFATTAFINANAPYTIVGWRAEFPRVATGMTLGNYTGLYLEGPLGGGGAVTNAFALVTAPGSGNVGIGTTAPAHLLDVAGDARVSGAIRAGQYLDLAGNPIGGAGDITDVTAGTGLTGGGTAGAVTLSANFAGTGTGSTISRSDHNHDATYALLGHNHDANYLSLAGGTLSGALTGTNATFTGTVSALLGSFTGTVQANGFLNLSGVSVGLRTDCALGNVVRWAGTAWICDTAGQGTVTQIVFGNGLTGGTITTNGNVSFDTVFGDARYALNGHNHDAFYLPLTGGTLIGALNGSTANFTGGVTTNNLTLSGSINTGFRVQATGLEPNIIGGLLSNTITAGALGATIAGGGHLVVGANRVTDDYGFIGGGVNNQAGDSSGTTSDRDLTTIGGGASNTASGRLSTIAGGNQNTASALHSAVGGGFNNVASGENTVVSGGVNNTASGLQATVPGGRNNTAMADYSFAAGRNASAQHIGSFVWADSENSGLVSTAQDQFTVRASGGVRFRNSAGDMFTSDGSGNLRANSIANLAGVNIGLRLDCTSGDVVQWSGTAWLCVSGGGTGSVTQIDTGTGLTGGPINTTGTIAFDQTYGDNRYVNAAGDTMSGVLIGTTASFSGNVMVQSLDITNGGINNSFFIQTTLGSPNIIAGVLGNQASGLVTGATISGGGDVSGGCLGALTPFNVITDDFGVVGGGCGNRAGNASGGSNDAFGATVGGGAVNIAGGNNSTVAGGVLNFASGLAASIGGGQTNVAAGFGATVAGGTQNDGGGIRGTVGGGGSNTASGESSTVPGGHFNTALGNFSFAAGRKAKANDNGSFVWADTTDADITSNGTNTFTVRASGGARFRNAGGDIFTIDGSGNVVASGSISAGSFPNMGTFSATPTGAGVAQGSLYVNPATAAANTTLFGVATGGTERFRVDAEGDLNLAGSINGGFRVDNSGNPPNIIGGFSGNSITLGVFGATIAGGGLVGAVNLVTDDFGTVGGGRHNQAGDAAGSISDRAYATVGGGSDNTASGFFSTVGGGASNTASGQFSAVGGGRINTASGVRATVGGGDMNTASGDHAAVGGGEGNTASGFAGMVPGGSGNTAQGSFSSAAGRRAMANHDGAFVWADSTDADVASGVANEFVVRASGGVRFRNTSADVFTIDGSGNLGVAGSINGGFRVDNSLNPPNILGGFSQNSIMTGVVGGVIAGGGDSSCAGAPTPFNRVTDSWGTIGGGCGNLAGHDVGDTGSRPYATVAGGRNNKALGDHGTVGGGGGNTASVFATVGGGDTNTASSFYATVAGGVLNTGSGDRSTVGGGSNHTASGFRSTVGGGFNNTASDSSTTVGGGEGNTASGFAATVPGGSGNLAQGSMSFAAGRQAKANHDGAFVWADSTNAPFASTGVNQFQVRATGGAFFSGGPVILGSVPNPTATNAGDLYIENSSGNAFNAFRLDAFADTLYISANSALGSVAGTRIQFRTATIGAGEADRMAITDTGNVGIGTTAPTERLHVIGNILASGNITPSSRRFKTNILPLSGALGLVERLQGVSYTRKDDGKAHIGFIAEDLGAVLPQVVLWEANGADAKGLDYARLTAVLVEAVKEQQAQLRAQQARNERLERELAELRAAVAQLAAQAQPPQR